MAELAANTDRGKPSTDAILPEDGLVPIPPRYWWLKRISIGVGVLLVGLVVLRLWWGWVADRRLQAEIDRIAATGEPFYPEDYIEDVPDELNAAILYDEAAAACGSLPESSLDLLEACLDLKECGKRSDEVRL